MSENNEPPKMSENNEPSKPSTESEDATPVSQPERRPFSPSLNRNLVTETLAMLGHKATDIISGAQGVISSVSFDLYGCVVCYLTPPATEKDAYTRVYDVQRMRLTDEPPVMAAPDFMSHTTTPDRYAHGGIDHDQVKHDVPLPAK